MPPQISKERIRELRIKFAKKKTESALLIQRRARLQAKQRRQAREKAVKLIQERFKKMPKKLYQYTISGNYQNMYQLKDKTFRFTQPKPTSKTFFSRTRLTLKPFMIVNIEVSLKTLRERGLRVDLPIVDRDDIELFFSKPEAVFLMPKEGSEQVLRITKLTLNRMVLEMNAELSKIPLYKMHLNLSYKGFDRIDSDNGLCVPESILFHLKKKELNKKLTLEKVIECLEEDYDPEFKKGRGYTPLDIIRVLETYKCKGRLLDINRKEFLVSNGVVDKHLDVFCAICYDEHLYYCSDREFIKSMASKIIYEETAGYFDFNTHEKTKKTTQEKSNVIIIEKEDLIEEYRENVLSGILPIVSASNGRIVSMKTLDTHWFANPEKTIMEEMMGDDFSGHQTSTNLGNKLFDEYTKKNPFLSSNFTKETFDRISKHGNIVKSVNAPKEEYQAQYDINKCRTDCLMNNKLGDFEIFDPSCNFREYCGVRRKGYYYIETDNTNFFMRGNGTYSNDYLLKADLYKIPYTILYELNCHSVVDANYFRDFVKGIILKYPDPRHYKAIINKFIGQLGRTIDKNKTGFIETDYNLAVKYFWENNEDKIGFLDNSEPVENAMWKKLGGALCNLDKIEISEGVSHYLLQKTKCKTKYNNSITIYNKVLENEYLRLYLLIKEVGGNLIKIKTDAIVVDSDYKRIKCNDLIGGIKYERVCVHGFSVSAKIISKSINVNKLVWNITTEKIGESVILPSGSCCITGPPGTGKTTTVKNLPEYLLDTTLRLGFTNVSTENLESENAPCHTLNSYFGINCLDGRFCEKKLKNLKGIKCIIITEACFIPSYIMGVLEKIKLAFKCIRFIGECDPSQNRPVKEEYINWLKTELFYNLFDGNLVQLTVNKRNNEFENYDKIKNGERLAEDKYIFREPQRINITKTNRKRIEINSLCMERQGGLLFVVPDNCVNDKTQDIRLKLDTPIMCIKNNKKLKLKNGKMYAIDSLDMSCIAVNGIEFNIQNFFETFVVCHAMTNHKVQGITIREPYNIYEWDDMPWWQRYTAYSRTSDGNFVKLL
jgi:hypothetical protein